MRITAHQPNLLPGKSVVDKIRSCDKVIWLDLVQYPKGGWTNRNRIAGAWLTVPVRVHYPEPIATVRIDDSRDWRARVQRTLHQHFAGRFWLDAVCEEFANTARHRLVELNVALLSVTLGGLARWRFQSELVPLLEPFPLAVSHSADMLKPISEQLAEMVAELGGSVYVSGQSGRNYLDETPFRKRGIEVEYWQHSGPNPCILELL